jgi:uncharacterized protein (TIGR00255 family)
MTVERRFRGVGRASRIALIDRHKQDLVTAGLDPKKLTNDFLAQLERGDVTEELVRLKSHINLFLAALGTRRSGKKLEFTLQEIAREWNTIGSKAQDAKMQSDVISAKTELERIREQINNIE